MTAKAAHVGINIGGRTVVLSDWKDDSLYSTIDTRGVVDVEHPFVFPGWFDARWQLVAAVDVLRLETRRLSHNGYARRDLFHVLDEVRLWASGAVSKSAINLTAKLARTLIRGPRWTMPEVSIAASTLDPPYVGRDGAFLGSRVRELAVQLAETRRQWRPTIARVPRFNSGLQVRLYEITTDATGMLNRDPEVVRACEDARILDLSKGRPVVDEDVRAAALAACVIGERAAARRIIEEHLDG
jgi:hypothetical protein